MRFRRYMLQLAALLCLATLGDRIGLAATLDAPQDSGMRALGGGVFVAPDFPDAEVAGLKRLVEHARRRVALFYGAISAAPNIVFCDSTDCYRDFGGMGLGFSNGAHIVISPQGRRPAIVAHELAHVELAARVGGMERVLRIVPQWFDEGLAVMVSMAAEFSDDEWMEATAEGQAAPALGELETMEQWNFRTGRNGEHMQMTYGTARREVARWYAAVGQDGLADLLTSLETKEPFAAAYVRIEGFYREAAIAAAQEHPRESVPTTGRSVSQQPFTNPPMRGRAAW